MYRIGVDVGGTNIAIGVVDDSYSIIGKRSIKTSQVPEIGQMIEAIASGVKELISETGISESDVACVGVGVPGTAELDTGKVMYANNLGFEDEPFLPRLKEALGEPLCEKTYFDNDANAAAIGEYVTGGYTEKNFMMVTLGTGIGGGIIIDGKLIRGVNYAAAEFGHMSINIDDKGCNCGRRGCFETYASAAALVEQAVDSMEKDVDKKSLLWKNCGKVSDLDGEKFFEAVKEKDELALKVLSQYEIYLAEGLTNLINILQPEVLVLSGGITRAAEYYLDDVRSMVLEKVYSRSSKKNTRIEVAHGIKDAGDVGIIGAALLGE
ncbi:ROK family protein [Butyrivibrio proteoclasticus]|uniref:ROK family protein n=1 Tax=Butyrivibrio proteoclasticus TaxID=43305 RepID=UPI00047B271D|nr:ROK family protein [Butyrivibrio proteoclasticus]